MELFIMIAVVVIAFVAVFYVDWDKEKTATSDNSEQKTTNVTTDSSKYKSFDLEYFPIADLYYPRKNGLYIYRNPRPWDYELRDERTGCEASKTEAGAIKIIDAYIEQKSAGTKIIKITGE